MEEKNCASASIDVPGGSSESSSGACLHGVLLLSQLRGGVAERLLSTVQQILAARQPTQTVVAIEPPKHASPSGPAHAARTRSSR